MKILTWNINHRISKKKIPREMAEALASLSPDIIVLTEYVEGPSHNQFLADLKSNGFSDWRFGIQGATEPHLHCIPDASR